MESGPSLNSKEILDERWYPRFEKLSFSAFEMLDDNTGQRLIQKDKFLNGEIDNPELNYPKLEGYDFDGHESELLMLKQEIIEQEPNRVIVEIYRTKINEAIAELRMLKMARDGNDKRFYRYSRFVYGNPDEENTNITAEVLNRKIADKARDISPEISDVMSRFSIPSKTENLVDSQQIKGRVGSIDEVTSAFEEALLDIDASDWKIVKNSNKSITNFRVSQQRKEVSVPEHSSANMLKSKLASFIQHEIYGHVQRRVNGERTSLKLLGLGLDRVEKGEEGVATYLEQQVTGASNFSHPERYFAIALASGEVDGVPKNFRQTFSILKQYYEATLKEGEDLDERAANSAWTLTMRIFRGTTGKTPGAVFTKDLAYFLGNKETWALVNTDQSIVQHFTIGKFDAANERHVGWLVSLGIADEDLVNINNQMTSS